MGSGFLNLPHLLHFFNGCPVFEEGPATVELCEIGREGCGAVRGGDVCSVCMLLPFPHVSQMGCVQMWSSPTLFTTAGMVVLASAFDMVNFETVLPS